MDKELLKGLVRRGRSIRQIAAQVGKSYTATKYWLNKYGLRTKFKRAKRRTTCSVCARPLKKERGRRCGTCDTGVRRLRAKIAGAMLLGGECVVCGLKVSPENIAGFDFHHRKETQKSFQVSRASFKAWAELRVEMQKCDLFCSMCHRNLHGKPSDALLREARQYRGPIREVQDLMTVFWRDE